MWLLDCTLKQPCSVNSLYRLFTVGHHTTVMVIRYGHAPYPREKTLGFLGYAPVLTDQCKYSFANIRYLWPS